MRRSRKKYVFDLSTKLRIMHRVIVGKESQAELAKEFRVTAKFISHLISTLKKKKELLGEMILAVE